ncbi:MAG: bi-domain-containing oxidoreductase [Ignavibacteriae bacterium]|nr:bi-domain-containing oxidoreductase [Ignavibacteriota bacterium]
MLQIIQYQKTGELSVADLPSPQLKQGSVLVRNVASVISAGTERSSVQTAQASLVGKARSRPDLVRQVLDNVKREGLVATYEKVQNRLDNYKELGYSSAGIVLQSSVPEFRTGDRVACAGVAYHAEEILVPKNLAVKIPDSVPFESAAFTTIGAIALQGVRQAEARLGETVAVIGVGLLGLLTIQLLKAAGCRVIGLDLSDANFAMALQFGCDATMVSNEDAIRKTLELTQARGADAVIITASTQSSEPANLAMKMSRKRGRLVVVGAIGMELQRSPFYEKELDFRISCSYGPGRYDAAYEIEGHDYPIGYVRWTENRNMEAVLDLMSQQRIDCHSLITHRFPIANALSAYDVVTGKTNEKYLAVVMEYPHAETQPRIATRSHELASPQPGQKAEGIGFIGAGNFAQSYLLPNLTKAGISLTGVVTTSPAHAKKTAEKFGFAFGETDASKVLDNDSTGTLFIATRHDSHAAYVSNALKRGKHVFVEKPLAITNEQLLMIEQSYDASPKGTALLTGFNRRFSKPWRDIRHWFADAVEPYALMYRVNAGALQPNHWLMSAEQGGRLIGEVCHFVDCMQFITGSRPLRVFAEAVAGRQSRWKLGEDVVITLSFADGSVGTIAYLTNTDPSLDKEFCEISSGGKTAIMNNYSEVVFYQNRKKKRERYDGTKGHKEEVQHFLELIKGRTGPVLSAASQFDTTRTTLRAVESLQSRCALDV